MKKIVIIEDEIPARKKLVGFVHRLEEKVEILAELASVVEAVEFFSKEIEVDLIISDIQLLDGNAFEIFEQTELKCPVIFTTAFDRFWMDAFESNGIDYLLKPFSFERFLKSWEKFLRLSHSKEDPTFEFLGRFRELLVNQANPVQSSKSRIMVPSASGMYFLEFSEVSYFIAENGVVKATDSSGKKHLLRQGTLKEVEEIADSRKFFRINRAHLVNKFFIERLDRYGKNAVVIFLKNSSEKLVTSQSATAAFLDWMEE